MNIQKEIAQYFKPEYMDFEISDALMSAPNSYKVGEAREFTINGFSTAKVLDVLGITELSVGDFGKLQKLAGVPSAMNNGDFEKGTYGVSFPLFRLFSLSPNNKLWQYTLFHELGHIFLEHSRNFSVDEVVNDVICEIEADLFSYFIMKKLGMDLSKYAMLISKKFSEIDFQIPKHVVGAMDKAANAFLEIGRI